MISPTRSGRGPPVATSPYVDPNRSLPLPPPPASPSALRERPSIPVASRDAMPSGSFATSDSIVLSVPVPARKQVWTGEAGGWLRVRHMETGDIVHQHHFSVARLITAITATARKIWVGHRDGSISVFDGETLGGLIELQLHEGAVTGLEAASALGRVLSVAVDGRISVWDDETMRCLSSNLLGIGPLSAVASGMVRTSPDSELEQIAFVGSQDGDIKACTMMGAALPQPSVRSAHNGAINAIAHDFATGYVWTVGQDGRVKVFDSHDLAAFEQIACISEHTGPVSSIAINRGEGKVWTLGKSGNIVIFDSRSFRPEQHIHGSGLGTTGGRSASVTSEANQPIVNICATQQTYVWKVWVCGSEGTIRLYTSPSDGPTLTNMDALTSSLNRQLQEEVRVSAQRATQLQKSVDSLNSKLQDAAANEETLKANNDALTQQNAGLKEALERETATLSAELTAAKEAKERAESELKDVHQELSGKSDAERSLFAQKQELQRAQQTVLEAVSNNEKLRAEVDALRSEREKNKAALETLHLELDKERMTRERQQREFEAESDLKTGEIMTLRSQMVTLNSELENERNRTPPASPARGPYVVRMDLDSLSAMEVQVRSSFLSLESWSRATIAMMATSTINHQTESEDNLRRIRRELHTIDSGRKTLDLRCEELENNLANKNHLLQQNARESNDSARSWKDKMQDAQADIDSLNRQLDSAKEKITRLEEERESILADSEARVETMQSKHSEVARQAHEERELLASELESAIATAKSLRTDLDVSRAKLVQAENGLAAADDSYRNIEARAQRAEKRAQRLETDVVERDNEINKLNTVLSMPKDDTQTRTLQEQLNRKDSEIRNVQKEVERLSRVQHDLETSLDLERTRVSDAEKAMRNAIDKSERAAQSEESARAQASLAEDNHRTQHNQLQASLDQVRRELKVAEDAKNQSEASLSKMQASTQRAIEERNLQAEKAELKLSVANSEIEELKNTVNSLSASKATQMNSFIAENDNLVSQLRTLRNDMHRVEEERDRFRQAHDSLQDNTTNVQTLKQDIKFLNAAKNDLEGALATTEQRARTAEQDRERALSETARVKSEMNTLNRTLDQIRREVSEKDQELNTIRSGHSSKEREWSDKAAEYDSQISKLRADLTKRHQEIDDLQEAKTRIEAEGKRQMAVVQNEMQQMDSEVSTLQRQVHEGAFQSDRLIMQGEITELRNNIGSLQKEINNKRQEVKDERDRTHRLENDLNSKLRDEQNTIFVMKNEVHSLQQQLKAREDEKAALQRRLEEALKRNEDIANDVTSRSNQENAKLRGENSVLTTENTRLTTENTGLNRQVENLQHDHKIAFRNQKSEHDRAVDDLNNQIAELQKDIRTKSQELSKAIKAAEEKEIELVSRNRSDFTILSTQVDDAKHHAESHKSNAMAQASEFQRAKILLDEKIQSLESQLQAERHNSEQESQQHMHEQRALQNELRAKNQECVLLKQQLQDSEEEVTSRFRNERNSMVSQNEMLKDQVSSLQRDLKVRLSELLHAQRAIDEKEVVNETQLREERSALELKVTRLDSECARLREVHSGREVEMREVSVAAERMKAQMVKINAERAMTQAEVDELRDENSRLGSSIRQMQSEMSNVADELEKEKLMNSTNMSRLRDNEESHLNHSLRLEQSSRALQSDLEVRLEEQKAETKKAQRSAMVHETMVEEVREQARALIAEKERLAQDCADLRAQYEDAHRRLNDALKEVYPLRDVAAQRDGALRRAEDAEAEADLCRKRLKEIELGAQGDELSRRDELHALRTQLSMSEAERKRLLEELEAAQRVLERVRGDTSNSLGRASELERQIRQLQEELDLARRKIVGLEETLAMSQAKRDIPYIERQVALVGQLLKKATGPEIVDYVQRAQAALNDILTYLRNAKLQEQQTQQGGVVTPGRGIGNSPWT